MPGRAPAQEQHVPTHTGGPSRSARVRRHHRRRARAGAGHALPVSDRAARGPGRGLRDRGARQPEGARPTRSSSRKVVRPRIGAPGRARGRPPPALRPGRRTRVHRLPPSSPSSRERRRSATSPRRSRSSPPCSTHPSACASAARSTWRCAGSRRSVPDNFIRPDHSSPTPIRAHNGGTA